MNTPRGSGRERHISSQAQPLGLALVELVVVLLILAVMAAAALPNVTRALCYYRADAAAKRIIADVTMAQRRAIASSANQSIQFAPTSGANTYIVSGVANLDHPSQTYTVDLSAEPYRATLVSASFSTSKTITFDRYGTPSPSGGTVVVQAGNSKKTISIDSDTGKATAQ